MFASNFHEFCFCAAYKYLLFTNIQQICLWLIISMIDYVKLENRTKSLNIYIILEIDLLLTNY